MNTELKNSEMFLTNNVGKKSGFKVPKDYFETLEDDVFAKLTTDDFEIETGFEVPNNYFDGLENQILAKISSEEKEVKVIPLRTKIANFASIAAAACILLFVGFHFFGTSETNSFENLPISDVVNWAENNMVMIDNYDLNNAFEVSDFDENELLSSEISDETIENYLTNADTSTLLNEID